jgi:hypothetical protein
VTEDGLEDEVDAGSEEEHGGSLSQESSDYGDDDDEEEEISVSEASGSGEEQSDDSGQEFSDDADDDKQELGRRPAKFLEGEKGESFAKAFAKILKHKTKKKQLAGSNDALLPQNPDILVVSDIQSILYL